MSTYYVAALGGDNRNPGTAALPWQTLQKAADTVAQGDTVYAAGNVYPEMVFVSTVFNLISTEPRKAVIDSSMAVSGWTNVGGEVWQAPFRDADYAPSAGGLGRDYPGVFPNKSSPGNQWNDILAWVHLDNGIDQASWLRPRENGAPLNRGEFSTDVTGDRGTPGSVHTLRVRLADGGLPAQHTVRIPRYHAALYVIGAPTGAMTVTGFRFQRAGFHMLDCDKSDITFRDCEGLWYKGFGINAYHGRRNVLADGCDFHHYEYEGIHLSADASTIRGGRLGPVIAPWSNYGAVGINVTGADGCTVQDTEIFGMLRSVDGTGGTAAQAETWYRDGAVHGHGHVFERLRIHDNETHGVVMEGRDHTLRDSLIYANGGAGVGAYRGTGGGSHPTEATGLTIVRNRLVRNATASARLGYGVHALQFDDATEATVQDNIIYDHPGGDKYYASGTRITEAGNRWGDSPLPFVAYDPANPSSAWDLRLAGTVTPPPAPLPTPTTTPAPPPTPAPVPTLPALLPMVPSSTASTATKNLYKNVASIHAYLKAKG